MYRVIWIKYVLGGKKILGRQIEARVPFTELRTPAHRVT